MKDLLTVEAGIGSNFSGIYREWFDKISNRDERWSFLEYLEGLEMADFFFCMSWLVDTELNKGPRVISADWRHRYDGIMVMSIREQHDILEYPSLSDGALEPPNSLKRLISSKGLPKDMEVALIQAWPSFRRNWPHTGRFTVFGLNNSDEALARLQKWMEAGSGAETAPLEEVSETQK